MEQETTWQEYFKNNAATEEGHCRIGGCKLSKVKPEICERCIKQLLRIDKPLPPKVESKDGKSFCF